MALVDVDTIMSIGRWATIKSRRGYLKMGEALVGQVMNVMTAGEEAVWAAFLDESISLYL